MIKKILLKATIAITLSIVISLICNSLVPILSNEIALGQLENDNAYFITLQAWNNQTQYYFGLATAAVWAACIASISVDVYKYMKNKKGENE